MVSTKVPDRSNGIPGEPRMKPTLRTILKAKKTRVIVLGAGMSGLACARELQQRGYQVLVVEARDRLGGRLKGGAKTNDKEGGDEGMKVLPTPVVGHESVVLKPVAKRSKKDTTIPVDLGGALIHGIEKNPIFTITEQMGIPTSPVSDCMLFDQSGWPIDTKVDDRISTLFNDCLEETFDRIAAPDRKKAAIPTDKETDDSSKKPAAVIEAIEASDKENAGSESPPSLSEDNVQTEERGTNNVSTPSPDASPPSFGDEFDKVCKERGAPRSDPIFQWHQANLEVSCGASFPDLGYKWNDDEQYGFNGKHNALKTSWKPVVEGLAEGIDIMYQSPVKQVVMVVPDPPPEPPPAAIESNELAPLQPTNYLGTGALSEVIKTKRKRARSPAVVPLPSRRSRRLQGDDAHARRSERANKGQKVERFLVSKFSTQTYEVEDDSQSVKGRNNGRHKQRQEEPESNTAHTTVQVTLEDGRVLEAEAVVCTLPLGILKLSSGIKESKETCDDPLGPIRFYPPLSERKQNAIKRLGCGLLNKCILSFSHVFWQDSDFLGLAHVANSYLILNVASFTNKPVLTFMYGGTFAKEIEAWTDNEIVADCMEVLRIICGKRDIPYPLDYAVTRWGHERYSRMSFSYVPPGIDGMEEYKAMSEAVYDPLEPKRPVIMFAGEHTTPFHPSTIHGAFLSGIREAYRLDLVIEPKANDHLEFEDDQLYHYTFAVRKQFHLKTVKSPVARASQPLKSAAAAADAPAEGTGSRTDAASSADTVGGADSQSISNSQSDREVQGGTGRRQHRRRGAASVMNLRQKPKTVLPESTQSSNGQRRRKPQQQEQRQQQRFGAASGAPPLMAKRSRRSVHSLQQQKVLEESVNILPVVGNVKNAPLSEEERLLQKKHLSSLETRTLMRALESYGHNYPLIHSLVLPVFGSTQPPRSLPQVQARCQQLIRSILSLSSAALPSRAVASWVARKVHEPPTINHKPNATGKNAFKNEGPKENQSSRKKKNKKTAPLQVEGTRRSSRQQKQREILDL